MAFEQAKLAVGNEAAFNEFMGVLALAFSPKNVERFLKSIDRKGLRVRQFEQVRDAGLLDEFREGKSASQLWQQLAVADQSQVREQYLTRLEEVTPEVRAKFAKLYQYA